MRLTQEWLESIKNRRSLVLLANWDWAYDDDGNVVTQDDKSFVAKCESKSLARFVAFAPEDIDLLIKVAEKHFEPAQTGLPSGFVPEIQIGIDPAKPGGERTVIHTTLGEDAFKKLSELFQRDFSYAWTWHCQLAVTIADGGVKHVKANEIAARFMKAAFGVDVTNSETYRQTVTEFAASLDLEKPKQVEKLRQMNAEFAAKQKRAKSFFMGKSNITRFGIDLNDILCISNVGDEYKIIVQNNNKAVLLSGDVGHELWNAWSEHQIVSISESESRRP